MRSIDAMLLHPFSSSPPALVFIHQTVVSKLGESSSPRCLTLLLSLAQSSTLLHHLAILLNVSFLRTCPGSVACVYPQVAQVWYLSLTYGLGTHNPCSCPNCETLVHSNRCQCLLHKNTNTHRLLGINLIFHLSSSLPPPACHHRVRPNTAPLSSCFPEDLLWTLFSCAFSAEAFDTGASVRGTCSRTRMAKHLKGRWDSQDNGLALWDICLVESREAQALLCWQTSLSRTLSCYQFWSWYSVTGTDLLPPTAEGKRVRNPYENAALLEPKAVCYPLHLPLAVANLVDVFPTWSLLEGATVYGAS